MNTSVGLQLPHVMLELQTTVYGTLSAGEGALHISVPFGELVIPYTRITRASKDASGAVRLDVSGGTRMLLDAANFHDRSALLDLLERKVEKAQS